jgi:hypothetical protein
MTSTTVCTSSFPADGGETAKPGAPVGGPTAGVLPGSPGTPDSGTFGCCAKLQLITHPKTTLAAIALFQVIFIVLPF